MRHGQSTWNAAGIIQGSSNISELTPKGISQAEVSGEMLRCGLASIAAKHHAAWWVPLFERPHRASQGPCDVSYNELQGESI